MVERAETLQDAGAATVAGLEGSPRPIGRWFLLSSDCARLKHPQIHFPNRPAPISERVTESFRRGEAATDRYAVIRRWIIGQDRLSLVAPTPQDAFDAPKLTVVLDELVCVGQRPSSACAFERAQGVGFLPTIVQAERLRDELRIHKAALAGFDGKVVQIGRASCRERV